MRCRFFVTVLIIFLSGRTKGSLSCADIILLQKPGGRPEQDVDNA